MPGLRIMGHGHPDISNIVFKFTEIMKRDIVILNFKNDHQICAYPRKSNSQSKANQKKLKKHKFTL